MNWRSLNSSKCVFKAGSSGYEPLLPAFLLENYKLHIDIWLILCYYRRQQEDYGNVTVNYFKEL